MPRLKPVDLNAASTNTERMSAAILAFLGTMSVMMTTPTLVERREIDARSGRAPVPDRTRPHDLVSLIDLRRDGSGRYGTAARIGDN